MVIITSEVNLEFISRKRKGSGDEVTIYFSWGDTDRIENNTKCYGTCCKQVNSGGDRVEFKGEHIWENTSPCLLPLKKHRR